MATITQVRHIVLKKGTPMCKFIKVTDEKDCLLLLNTAHIVWVAAFPDRNSSSMISTTDSDPKDASTCEYVQESFEEIEAMLNNNPPPQGEEDERKQA
jgi:hypothetical protein